MTPSSLLILVAGLALFGYFFGRRRAYAVAGGEAKRLHSLPGHYGTYVSLWMLLPALAAVFLWALFNDKVVTALVVEGLPASYQSMAPEQLNLAVNDIKNIASGSAVAGQVGPELQRAADHYKTLVANASAVLWAAALVLMLLGAIVALRQVRPRFRARPAVERVVRMLLLASSTVAILTTIGIVLSVLFESIRFFGEIPITDFLFGLEWSPQTAIREDQVGSSGAFGAIPLFAGTLLISTIAMLVAVPIGLLGAIYLAEYASARMRSVFKPMLEILAGVPTVVYGFFAALTVAPMIRNAGESIGLTVASESALAAGLVMGIMIIPFVSSLSDDVISAVPRAMRDGSLAMGATQSETIRKVILPAALPGIVGGVLLAASRAIGETMIVVMAAGLSANLTANPLDAVTTVTVQIVTLLVGDQEFDSAKTLAAFALGLMLFVTTLLLNIIALRVVRKYREQYD